MSVQRFVWRDGVGMVDKRTGEFAGMTAEQWQRQRNEFGMPAVLRPFEPYRSCVHGGIIDDRSDYREEIAVGKDKGLVPFERINGSPGGLINKEFCRRRGVRPDEATTEWADNKRKATAVKTDASGAIISE